MNMQTGFSTNVPSSGHKTVELTIVPTAALNWADALQIKEDLFYRFFTMTFFIAMN